MDTITKTVQLEILNLDSIEKPISDLILTAKKYLDFAYAPYSNFQVGAAVLNEKGIIYGGANQENASYPLCMCAERTALYHHAMADKTSKVIAIAITAKSPVKEITTPIMPCGACAQVISEYQMRYEIDIPIYLLTDDLKVYLAKSVNHLLPFGFDKAYLI